MNKHEIYIALFYKNSAPFTYMLDNASSLRREASNFAREYDIDYYTIHRYGMWYEKPTCDKEILKILNHINRNRK